MSIDVPYYLKAIKTIKYFYEEHRTTIKKNIHVYISFSNLGSLFKIAITRLSGYHKFRNPSLNLQKHRCFKGVGSSCIVVNYMILDNINIIE